MSCSPNELAALSPRSLTDSPAAVETHSPSLAGRPELWLALGAVLLAAVAMRAWVSFSTTWPTGMDAGYYPLQTRALLEHGRLAYHDLPLTFVIQAGVAKLLRLVAGGGLDDATVLAARLVDCLAPTFVAVALFALGGAWAREVADRRARISLAVGLAAAGLLATVSLPELRMAGDFQKNSLGLVWLAALAGALHQALAHGGQRHWVTAALALLLAGLTHVGVFGAAVVLAVTAVLVFVAPSRRPTWRQVDTTLCGVVVATCLVLVCVVLASPRRGVALLCAPLELFRHPPGERPLDPLGRLVCLAVYALLAWGAWTLWPARHTTDRARLAVVVGAGVCAALLACPLLNEEYFKRLVLMAPVPAAVVLMDTLCRRAAAGRRLWPALVVGALAVTSVGGGLGGGDLSRGITPQVITADQAAELRAMRTIVTDPARTVVLADKGLMWWAGFLMRVPVRQDRVPPAALARYRRVLRLESLDATADREPPPPDRAPWPAGPVLREGPHYRLSELPTL